MLNGLTTKKVEELIPLVKSWSNPARLNVSGGSYTSEGYDPSQMAYILASNNLQETQKLSFKLTASEDSPVINPAFVIKGWGDSDAELEVDGKAAKCGLDFRFGHRYRLEATDLIIWLKLESQEPMDFSIYTATE
jgi:hypothetical protein